MQRIDAGEIGIGRDPIDMINAQTDYELLRAAREHDQRNRSKRLAALRSACSLGDTRLIEVSVREIVETNRLSIEPASPDWRALADALIRAEIAALERTLERDVGNYGGEPADPIIKEPGPEKQSRAPVPLMSLFEDYIAARRLIGKHRDGGANWTYAIKDLIKFLGHGDATRITKRILLDWRDALLAAGKSPKTVSDKYLAAIRAVLKWAHENERIPTNEAAAVKQPVPRKTLSRERGYTTPEAVRILRASLSYRPAEAANPSNRESAQITAAKRWVPLVCAFTGARPTELTQLRKEDLRQEGGRWILRITPEAGSVKTGQFRDLPLHRQVVALGFTKFVEAAQPGPLFHRAKTSDTYQAAARVTSGRLSGWLNTLNLVPAEVQPLYGFRHRFKTQGRELGASDRVLDAIQGHPGKTASDGYGDVTIAAKVKAIDMLPDYDLGEADEGRLRTSDCA